jgi:hypothetical protein
MANHERLNVEQHKNIRVIPAFSADLGDNQNRCAVFPSEFATLQKEYPIFLERNPANGEYQAVTFLGFDDNENCYLSANGQWLADYIPAAIAKGPFLIGLTQDDAKIDINRDHPKVSSTQGELLFDEKGQPTPYLDYISDVLFCLHQGITKSQEIYQLWHKHELIDGIDMNIDFEDKSTFSASHLLTINHNKLATLSADALLELNTHGALEAAFWMTSSLANVKKLMAKRQQKLVAEA